MRECGFPRPRGEGWAAMRIQPLMLMCMIGLSLWVGMYRKALVLRREHDQVQRYLFARRSATSHWIVLWSVFRGGLNGIIAEAI